MIKNLKKNAVHYLFLLLILVLGFGSFFLVSYDRSLQQKIAVLISLSYFCWGVIHHLLQDDLHPKIVIEYLLISALAFLVLFALVQRA